MGGPSRLLVGFLVSFAAILGLSYLILESGAEVASAQNGTTNATPDYVVTVYPVASKDAWMTKSLSFPAGSKVQLVYNSTKAVFQHDIQVCPATADPTACSVSGTGVVTGTAKGIASDSPPVATPVFTIPAAGLTYVCSVHPTTMVGKLTVGAFGGGAAEAESIAEVGVHYLAYWVGVISFALMFVVYGATFFLFKHGETPETTDQKDRPGFEEKRTSGGLPEIFWVVVGVIVLGLAVVLVFRQLAAGF